jgi:two-component sensor histidine kinase
MLHDHLARARRGGTVEGDAYLAGVCGALSESLSAGSVVRLETEFPSVTLSADTALMLGMIMTELVTNAVKHGFAGSAAGTIRIRLDAENGGVRLHVSEDGGRGLPPDFEQRPGLGMKIVGALIGQAGGQLRIVPQPATFVVEIPRA